MKENTNTALTHTVFTGSLVRDTLTGSLQAQTFGDGQRGLIHTPVTEVELTQDQRDDIAYSRIEQCNTCRINHRGECW
jgi:hypothetical protein